MTIQDLRRIVLSQQEQDQSLDSSKMRDLINRCRNVQFYHWSQHDHKPNAILLPKNCNCFNFIIGLPSKGNKRYALFDYEHTIWRAITQPAFLNTRKATEAEERKFSQMKIDTEQKVKSKNENIKDAYNKYLRERENTLIYPQKVGHLAILKSTGLGLTEFFLRYIAWICLKDEKLKGTDICIITGPREQLSIDIIGRLKKLFLPLGITFDTKESTLLLNGVRIRSFPSNNLSAMRGLSSVSFIYCDEAAFFDRSSQNEVIDVME